MLELRTEDRRNFPVVKKGLHCFVPLASFLTYSVCDGVEGLPRKSIADTVNHGLYRPVKATEVTVSLAVRQELENSAAIFLV